jgi:hypothetical protein
MSGANKFQLGTEGVTIRDSTFNFNTGSFTRGYPQAPRVLVNVLPAKNLFSRQCVWTGWNCIGWPCSPSYCSAPQTWQTDSHRLMRDRHLRHTLNRARHHRNEDASAAKTRIMTFWIIATAFSCQAAKQKSLSQMNDEQCRPAGLPVCLERVSIQFSRAEPGIRPSQAAQPPVRTIPPVLSCLQRTGEAESA